MAPTEGRSAGTTQAAGKRALILQVATELFLAQGYDGTSTDQVAQQAAISKQTLYKHFSHKEQLFAEALLGAGDSPETFDYLASVLSSTHNVNEDLPELARVCIRAAVEPRSLQASRLLVAEGCRFPDLGAAAYEAGGRRKISALAGAFAQLDQRGLLHVQDASLAAEHFLSLVLAIPLARALGGGESGFTERELDRLAEEGARVFLAAYGSR